MKRLRAILAALLASAALATPGVVAAMTVSPPMLDMSADAGQTSARSFTLRNEEDHPLHFSLSTANFRAKSGDEARGIPEFYPSDEERDGHGLAPWISLKKKEGVLAAGAERAVPFEVRVPAGAEPGSYYGAVIVGVESENPDQDVGVIGSVAVLVFLRVNGNAAEQLTLESFEVPARSFGLPIRFEARVRNDGSVHLRPYGEVTIKNMFGKTVTTLTVNRLEYKTVLPGTARRYATMWSEAKTGEKARRNFVLGRYTAELTLRYGVSERVATSKAVFWVLPPIAMAVVATGVLVACLIALYIARSKRRRPRLAESA